MPPFRFVLPGWAGSRQRRAWRWRATNAASPGLICCIPWSLCPRPDPAPRSVSFGAPAVRSSRPAWCPQDSPPMLSPQYFSTYSLMYLTLFLRSAKYTASHRLQQANHRTQTKENSFLISLTRPKQHLQHFPNLNMWDFPAKKTPNHPLWQMLAKLRCTLHISVHRMPLPPLLGPQALETSPLLPWLTKKLLLKSFLTAECVI